MPLVRDGKLRRETVCLTLARPGPSRIKIRRFGQSTCERHHVVGGFGAVDVSAHACISSSRFLRAVPRR